MVRLSFQPLVGDVLDLVERLRRLVGPVVKLVDEADLARQRSRQHLRHIVPMPLEDDARHDALQQHHRRHQDDERALIEPGRQVPFQESVESPPQGSRGLRRCMGHDRSHHTVRLFDMESITGAAHRLQKNRIGRVDLDLLAQAVDLHIDAAQAFLAAGLCEFRTAHRLARPLGEEP